MIPPCEQRYRFLKGVIDSIKGETLSARQHRLSIQFNLKFPATTLLGKSRVFNLEVDEDEDTPVTSKKTKEAYLISCYRKLTPLRSNKAKISALILHCSVIY